MPAQPETETGIGPCRLRPEIFLQWPAVTGHDVEKPVIQQALSTPQYQPLLLIRILKDIVTPILVDGQQQQRLITARMKGMSCAERICCGSLADGL